MLVKIKMRKENIWNGLLRTIMENCIYYPHQLKDQLIFWDKVIKKYGLIILYGGSNSSILTRQVSHLAFCNHRIRGSLKSGGQHVSTGYLRDKQVSWHFASKLIGS